MKHQSRTSSLLAGVALCISAAAFAQSQTSGSSQTESTSRQTQSSQSDTASQTGQSTRQSQAGQSDTSSQAGQSMRQSQAGQTSSSRAGSSQQGSMLPERNANEAFVRMAAQNSLAEVQLAQLALQKSQDPNIRQFAQRMIDDHRKANSQLMSIAKANNIEVPTTLDQEHRQHVDMLRKMDGQQFDRAYAEHMTMDHQKSLSLFTEATRNQSVSRDLANFANQTLPTLKQHQQLAQQLESTQTRSAEGSSSGSSSSQGQQGQSGTFGGQQGSASGQGSETQDRQSGSQNQQDQQQGGRSGQRPERL